jgi:hypothetical protein
MAWRRLTKQQWAAICIHLPQAKSPTGADACALMIGAVLRAFCGSSGRPRNVTMDARGLLSPRRYLIYDRDGTFCPAFQQTVDDAGIMRVPLPPQSPNLNADAERRVPGG